jgi:hypothetical protein
LAVASERQPPQESADWCVKKMAIPLPKTHKPQAWDRPKPSGVGDSTPEPIWGAIGFALTKWERAEDILASIFRHAVDSDSAAASRAFGAIQSHRGRSDALATAAEVYFAVHNVDKELQKDLALLLEHFGLASARRNEIAHAVLINIKTSTVEHNFLVPPEYNSRKFRAFEHDGESSAKFGAFEAHYRYTSVDVFGIASKFDLLIDAATEFLRLLVAAHPRGENGSSTPAGP